VELKISVVIPTKNRIKDLKECVESLINQTQPIDELIVVDGSTDNETKEYIEEIKRRVSFKCIYVRQNKGGLSTARNIGNKESNGDIIFQLEDDIVLHKDYINKIVEIFLNDRNGEIGGVAGVNEKESENKIDKLYNLLSTVFGIVFLRTSPKGGDVTIAGHHSKLPTNKVSDVKWLFNGAFRKEVVKQFKYDERLEAISPFAYYEDFDYSYRVSTKYKLVIVPAAKYIHRSSQTGHYHLGTFRTNSVKIQNHYYLVEKYNFSKIAFWWSTFGLLLAHMILLTIQPCKKNYFALKGIIDGMINIMSYKWRTRYYPYEYNEQA